MHITAGHSVKTDLSTVWSPPPGVVTINQKGAGKSANEELWQNLSLR
jgi:hypothetical protein